jgi:transcriptional regulator with XRE-family HTH domain
VELSERITRWREWAGLTQAALASKIGISAPAVSQWEIKEGTTPTTENLRKIAEACKVSLRVFWGRVPPAKKKKARAAA